MQPFTRRATGRRETNPISILSPQGEGDFQWLLGLSWPFKSRGRSLVAMFGTFARRRSSPSGHNLACPLLGERLWSRAKTMGHSSNCSVKVEWIAAVAFAAGTAAVGYLAYKKFFSKGKGCNGKVNLHIQKDNPKVVHAFDMEDLGEKAVYCRCWRSKTFPLCDGSHTKHNDETGDNVGPLIIKRKDV